MPPTLKIFSECDIIGKKEVVMLKDFYEITNDYASVKPVSNYHSHNYLCGHAGGTVSDYVRVAVENGMRDIGISDHCVPPLGTPAPYITPDTLSELYLPQFDEAERLYGDKIKIHRGAEIEFFAGFDAYYDKLLGSLEYLVLGEHEFICDGQRKNSFCDGTDETNIISYFDNVIQGLESGKFALLAHPDLIFYSNPKITPKIVDAFDATIKTAVRCDIPVELNANGIRNHKFKYPGDLLIELCKRHDAKVAISSDCHHFNDLCDEYMLRLLDYAQKAGLNIVDKL